MRAYIRLAREQYDHIWPKVYPDLNPLDILKDIIKRYEEEDIPSLKERVKEDRSLRDELNWTVNKLKAYKVLLNEETNHNS